MATTPLPSPHEPFIDTQTGKVTDVWYRFLNQNTVAANAALTSPVAVPDGGTGSTSHTAYAVLCGGTSADSAIQSLAGVGTTGQVLTSNGSGALPTFQAAQHNWTLISKTSDQTIASSTSQTADAHILFAASSATKYVVRGKLFGQTAGGAAGGLTISMTGPASPNRVYAYSFTVTDANVTASAISTAFGVNMGIFTGSTAAVTDFSGYIDNGANAGTVNLKWAQTNSNTTGTTLLQGSFWEYRAV